MSQLEWHEYPDWHEREPMWSITFEQYSEHFAEPSTAKSEQTLTISERPDVLVFDLDPGEGVSWDFVVETAFRVRVMLAGLAGRN